MRETEQAPLRRDHHSGWFAAQHPGTLEDRSATWSSTQEDRVEDLMPCWIRAEERYRVCRYASRLKRPVSEPQNVSLKIN